MRRRDKNSEAILRGGAGPAIAVRRTASLLLAYVPGIHVLLVRGAKDVDGGSSPAMTEKCLRAFAMTGSERRTFRSAKFLAPTDRPSA
jgi:hypothetical protein